MFPNSIGELIPQRLRSCNEYNHLLPCVPLFGWVRNEPAGDGARPLTGRVAFSYGRVGSPKLGRRTTYTAVVKSQTNHYIFYLKTQDGSAPYPRKMATRRNLRKYVEESSTATTQIFAGRKESQPFGTEPFVTQCPPALNSPSQSDFIT